LIPFHFQIAVLTRKIPEGFHWTAYDVLIERGHVYIFCFDAAEDAASLNQANYIQRTLGTEHCDFFLYSNPSQETWTVQTSERGCRTFVVENISRLSQVNILRTLIRLRDEGKLSRMGNFFDVSVFLGEKLPEDMGTHVHRVTLLDIVDYHPDLFRLAQSWTRLNRYPPTALTSVVSSSGRTLEQYARHHSERMLVKNEVKWVHAGMFHKDASQHRKIEGMADDDELRETAVQRFHRLLAEHDNPHPQAQLGNRTHDGVIRHLLHKHQENLTKKITFLEQQKIISKLAIAQRNNPLKKPLYYWKLYQKDISPKKSDFLAKEYQRNVNGQYVYDLEKLREIKTEIKAELQKAQDDLQRLIDFINRLPPDDNNILNFLEQNEESLDSDIRAEIALFFQNFPAPPAALYLAAMMT
jgi:hypothetical protein